MITPITPLWLELGNGYLVRQYLIAYRSTFTTFTAPHTMMNALFGQAYRLRWKNAKHW